MNGMRVRRSVGVCTRGDRPDKVDCGSQSGGGGGGGAGVIGRQREGGGGGEGGRGRPWGGKLRCAMLKSRFKVPMQLPGGGGRQRRPSKERREVLDTGKVVTARPAAAAAAADDGISATATTIVPVGRSRVNSCNATPNAAVPPPNPVPAPSSANSVKSPAVVTGNGTTKSIGGGGLAAPNNNRSNGSNGNSAAPPPTPTPSTNNNSISRPPPVILSTPVVPKPPPPAESEVEKEKKRLARKKERRATLILGLIMGSFIACWFPFFFLYSISPVCPICEEAPDAACCVRGWGFSFAFWLGYSNSALNPVIYTIFNKDFRRAFKRILFK